MLSCPLSLGERENLWLLIISNDHIWPIITCGRTVLRLISGCGGDQHILEYTWIQILSFKWASQLNSLEWIFKLRWWVKHRVVNDRRNVCFTLNLFLPMTILLSALLLFTLPRYLHWKSQAISEWILNIC